VHRTLLKERQNGDAYVTSTSSASSTATEIFAVSAAFPSSSAVAGSVATALARASFEGISFVVYFTSSSPVWRVIELMISHNSILSIVTCI
jgi:hypothetical protein